MYSKMQKLYHSSNRANRRLNLHSKNNTECVTLAKIQGKQVAKLGSNDHVYHGNMPIP